jgi:hypothetical protein
MPDLDPQYQTYCNRCWRTFPIGQLSPIGSQVYCKECLTTMSPPLEDYAYQQDQASSHGKRLAGTDNIEDEVQGIIRDNPQHTPKGEEVVVAGVPIGSDINSGRNDSGRGAVPPGTPSLATPHAGATAKASAERSLSDDGGSRELKSRATKQTARGTSGN